jgi:hypothetical protein
VERVLNLLDCAVLVISAVEGVQAQTRNGCRLSSLVSDLLIGPMHTPVRGQERPMRSATQLCFFALLLTAACSSSEEVGSEQQAQCACDETPENCCCNSPILLDIAGNGFELTSLDDGVKVATRPGYEQTERAWTAPGSDDAWLVLDRNRDGVINDMSEMFGNTTPQPEPLEGQRRNGFLALALHDDNDDAVIDEKDRIFGSVRLWQDKNHDGVSQPVELHELPKLGVAGISVAYTEDRRGDGHGNLFLYKAPVYGTPGSSVGESAWDVWLSGVQSMPLPDSPSTRSAQNTPNFWECRGTCRSRSPGCQNAFAMKTGPASEEAALRAQAQADCRALVDNNYCDVAPGDVVTTCNGNPLTCTASCQSRRNGVPSVPCRGDAEGPKEVTYREYFPTSEGLVREETIVRCLHEALSEDLVLDPETGIPTYQFCEAIDYGGYPAGDLRNFVVTSCESWPPGGGGDDGGGGC